MPLTDTGLGTANTTTFVPLTDTSLAAAPSSPSSPPPLPPPMPSLASSPSYYVNQHLDLYPNSERIGQSRPPKSWSEVSPHKYTPPDAVISIRRLAAALAKYTYFGEEVMRRSTHTGTRNKHTIPLDPEKIKV